MTSPKASFCFEFLAEETFTTERGFTFIKETEGRSDRGSGYELMFQGERIGRAVLLFQWRNEGVGFDIEIDRQGQNFGITALRGLADILQTGGVELTTAGINPEATNYWEHLVDKGLVEPTDVNRSGQYRVLPTLSESKNL